MQDIRLRIGTAILLCLSAFISIPGAIAVFLWWLAFSGHVFQVIRMRIIMPVAVMLAFFSAVLALSGGDGISYFIRMMVIVLIGFWVYAEQKSGEFLRFGVWLLGERWGFELGMLADMGLQTMHLLIRDFDQIRLAESLKGFRPGWKTIVPGGVVLVSGALMRAEHTAELLAARGYRNGGSLSPVFITPAKDILLSLTALCVLIIALISVSEFFILYG
ncbi:MAG: energy-coupling factor transporter transmembrane protein EcfT [Methanospirillum sp.]|nr:energy-coupling factor transporter transmembrane protein EcfT [Methanospirillum sp.]